MPATYEYTGIEGNFVRVNISVVKDGKIELGRFVQLLMQSAQGVNPMPLYDWRGQWQRIAVSLRTLFPVAEYNEDTAKLEKMFDGGNYVYHHSRRFNEVYAPHYRLIRRDLFEQEILPLLK